MAGGWGLLRQRATLRAAALPAGIVVGHVPGTLCWHGWGARSFVAWLLLGSGHLNLLALSKALLGVFVGRGWELFGGFFCGIQVGTQVPSVPPGGGGVMPEAEGRHTGCCQAPGLLGARSAQQLCCVGL